MNYGTIAYLEKPISKLVFGCANPAMIAGEQVTELLDTAYEAGINAFDTAEIYGESETVLGNWVRKRKNREKIVLITKGCHPHEGPRVNTVCLRQDLEQSLLRLKTDYIDIYFLHRDHPDADVGAIVEELNACYREGKIRAFGASNWTHERIAVANAYAREHGLVPFSVSSPYFGPAKRVMNPWGDDTVSIAGEENKEAREWYRREKIAIFAYSSLGSGMFSGKIKTSDLEHTKNNLNEMILKTYWCQENLDRLKRMEEIAEKKECNVAQLTLAWVMQQPFEAFPIVTVSDAGRIRENAEAAKIRLSGEEIKQIEG